MPGANPDGTLRRCVPRAEGTTRLENLLDSDDIRYMVSALGTLGLKLEEDRAAGRCTVHGAGGRFPSQARFECCVLWLYVC